MQKEKKMVYINKRLTKHRQKNDKFRKRSEKNRKTHREYKKNNIAIYREEVSKIPYNPVEQYFGQRYW